MSGPVSFGSLKEGRSLGSTARGDLWASKHRQRYVIQQIRLIKLAPNQPAKAANCCGRSAIAGDRPIRGTAGGQLHRLRVDLYDATSVVHGRPAGRRHFSSPGLVLRLAPPMNYCQLNISIQTEHSHTGRCAAQTSQTSQTNVMDPVLDLESSDPSQSLHSSDRFSPTTSRQPLRGNRCARSRVQSATLHKRNSLAITFRSANQLPRRMSI